MYLLAFLLPPAAVFMCKKPIQGIINIALCFLFILPAIIHAMFVVHEYKADERMSKYSK